MMIKNKGGTVYNPFSHGKELLVDSQAMPTECVSVGVYGCVRVC